MDSSADGFVLVRQQRFGERKKNGQEPGLHPECSYVLNPEEGCYDEKTTAKKEGNAQESEDTIKTDSR